ncbi:Pre-mRNA-processing ATP-dependent RNA helicase prp5 [Smittium mucronatum]|uniref:RNA helicase n=1 Tax=Smittium mucronatum TaxID=133383 RepID=A0A1R0GV83_9FUNG|nr:Pre-mRNA-processing ATP-dependent RNA helicase prp5 [Smittium mucronatum]
MSGDYSERSSNSIVNTKRLRPSDVGKDRILGTHSDYDSDFRKKAKIEDSIPENVRDYIGKIPREKYIGYNAVSPNNEGQHSIVNHSSLDRFSPFDVNQDDNINGPNCIINSFNSINNGHAAQKSYDSFGSNSVNSKISTLKDNIEVSQNIDLKALKRREKLELWKKKKENSVLLSHNSIPDPKEIVNKDLITDQDTIDKVHLRRLKAKMWIEKKSNSQNPTPEKPKEVVKSSGWSKVSNSCNSETNDSTKNCSQPPKSKNKLTFQLNSIKENDNNLSKNSKITSQKLTFGLKSNSGRENKFKGFEKSFKKNSSDGLNKGNKLINLFEEKSLQDIDHDGLSPAIKSFESPQVEPFAKINNDNLFSPVSKSYNQSPEKVVEKSSTEDEPDSLDLYLQTLSESDHKNHSQKFEDDLNNINKNESSLSMDVSVNNSSQSIEVEDGIPNDPESILELAARRIKKKDIISVDHSKMIYEPFKKDFYIEPIEVRNMSKEEVDELREDLDGIKIRGQNCPKPAIKWTYFGLPSLCIQTIKRLDFKNPTPIQAQSIPAILQGRDVIGVAKTGSGKTLAFLLPMIRHIKAQRPLENMEGPVGMVMTPTRELAVQIARECRTFAKPLGLRTICAYGGSPIKEQIGEFKRGAEIVICTPGRMIDLLSANSGRVTNLKRVTFLVLDEADRMFDMGFEPQVMKIIQNVRPDRQTLLFSATFPRQMEALARKVLKKPLEISIGGRTMVSPDIEQKIIILNYDEKFINLLEILGATYNENSESVVLVFVERQEAADNLFRDLLKRGYVCNSLHGGKDQADRDQTILDFKQGVFNLLIATSVAARGLDVKNLNLVVNYDCPNHIEDYIHRVGRTGRAGNKGTAVTFITPDQGRYAVEIVKVLQGSGVTVPTDLQNLANSFLESVKNGQVKYYNEGSSGGFGGKGLEKLDVDREAVKKIQRLTFGVEGDQDGEADENSSSIDPESFVQTNTIADNSKKPPKSSESADPLVRAAMKAAQKVADKFGNSVGSPTNGANSIKNAIDEVNAEFGYKQGSQNVVLNDDIHSAEYFAEIEINDFPQKARWKVTNRDTLAQITEATGAAITVRGIYIPVGKSSGGSVNHNNLLTASSADGSSSSITDVNIGSNSSNLRSNPAPERKLYLRIEGNSEFGVEGAKAELKRILAETTIQSIEYESRQGNSSNQSSGRYSVL